MADAFRMWRSREMSRDSGWKLSVLLDEHLSVTSATFATRATGFARQVAVQPNDHEGFLPGEG
jgi:hypothetical protein